MVQTRCRGYMEVVDAGGIDWKIEDGKRVSLGPDHSSLFDILRHADCSRY
jgi:hypothetical protein